MNAIICPHGMPARESISYGPAGKKPLDHSMEKAKEMGAGALAITGNMDFYGKSGFVSAKTKGMCRRPGEQFCL